MRKLKFIPSPDIQRTPSTEYRTRQPFNLLADVKPRPKFTIAWDSSRRRRKSFTAHRLLLTTGLVSGLESLLPVDKRNEKLDIERAKSDSTISLHTGLNTAHSTPLKPLLAN